MAQWEEVTSIRAMPFVGAERVLVADGDAGTRAWLRSSLAGHFAVEEVDSSRTALERLTSNPPRVLVVGRHLTDVSGAVLLTHAARHGVIGGEAPIVVFLIGPSPDEVAQVDEAAIQVFYRLTPALSPERVRDLLTQSITRQPVAAKPQTEADALRTKQVLEHAKRLGSQRDLKSAARAATLAVAELVAAERARCLYYDADSGSLWAEGSEQEESHASAGLAGFAVRTASAISLPRAGEDPVYVAAIDDPQGSGRERLAVQPVADKDGVIHAVLIAIRGADARPFAEEDMLRLEALAAAWAPFIHQLAQEVEASHVLEATRAEDGEGDLFRQEAIVHMVRRGHRGDVVRVHPAWVRAAYWMVLASLAGAIGFAAWARVHQYAQGPAVVRFTGRTEVASTDSGVIAGVEVAVGQTVKADQALVRMYDADQASQLRAIEEARDIKTAAWLFNPTPDNSERLRQAVAEHDQVKSRVDARVVRAPHDGVVKEISVRAGQRVEAGKVVAAVAEPGAVDGLSVIAFLPGRERPRLSGGQLMRMELPGFRGAYITLRVDAISADVMGAADARARFLGDRLGDSLRLTETVVVVEGRATSTTFEADGERYELHDGMIGNAEVRLSSESLLRTFVPGMGR